MKAFTYDVIVETTVPGRVSDAIDAFEHASTAAAEVLDRLTRAQVAGVDPLLPGDEFLLAESEYRRRALAGLVGIGQRKATRTVTPLASDWRDTTVVDWAKSRRAS